MSIEIIVLGVANALRPTSLACVYAILATTEPRRLLTAFLLAGFSFSLATGVIVVSLIHGAQIRHGTSTFRSRQPPRRRRHPPSRAPLPRGAEPDLVRRTAARAAIVDVTVFNALWWSIPIASLVLFLVRPAATRDGLAAIYAWTRSHDRAILAALFGVVGAYLSARGAANLLD